MGRAIHSKNVGKADEQNAETRDNHRSAREECERSVGWVVEMETVDREMRC